jgi:hypothetical protein
MTTQATLSAEKRTLPPSQPRGEGIRNTPLEIKLTSGETVRILTSPNPIGWSAVTDNYDLGSPQGLGKTRMEAITDLVDQLEQTREGLPEGDAIEDSLDPLDGVDGQFGVGA